MNCECTCSVRHRVFAASRSTAVRRPSYPPLTTERTRCRLPMPLVSTFHDEPLHQLTLVVPIALFSYVFSIPLLCPMWWCRCTRNSEVNYMDQNTKIYRFCAQHKEPPVVLEQATRCKVMDETACCCNFPYADNTSPMSRAARHLGLTPMRFSGRKLLKGGHKEESWLETRFEAHAADFYPITIAFWATLA